MTASTKVNLRKTFFGDAEHVIASHGGMTASLFRYETGIEAVRLKNERGYLVILPFMGQMIWDAVFDGVDLTMENMFSMPRPANVIVETYGCFAFHSGLLTNGCPGPIPIRCMAKCPVPKWTVPPLNLAMTTTVPLWRSVAPANMSWASGRITWRGPVWFCARMRRFSIFR